MYDNWDDVNWDLTKPPREGTMIKVTIGKPESEEMQPPVALDGVEFDHAGQAFDWLVSQQEHEDGQVLRCQREMGAWALRLKEANQRRIDVGRALAEVGKHL